MANDIVFEEHIDEVLAACDSAYFRGLEACGMAAETYAKKDAPVDTGRLRNSIAHQVNKEEKACYIGTNVEYAPYQEFGTVNGVPAHHFLRNAAANHSDEYKLLIKQSMENA